MVALSLTPALDMNTSNRSPVIERTSCASVTGRLESPGPPFGADGVDQRLSIRGRVSVVKGGQMLRLPLVPLLSRDRYLSTSAVLFAVSWLFFRSGVGAAVYSETGASDIGRLGTCHKRD